MNIIVCIKPVLDPDLPPMKFSIDAQKNSVIQPEGMPPVMNPYDALAVEAALQIKEKQKAGKITVVTLGAGEDIQRKALAMGADEAVIVKTEGVQEFDGLAKALLLSCAIKNIGTYDLVICGRQAADWDVGATGSMIAEYLGIPVLTRAKKIEIADGKLRIERITAQGNETYEAVLPALVTVSSEMGKARIPSGWGIINAAKKPVKSLAQCDLGADFSKVAGRNTLVKLYPASNERKCEIITGKNTEEATGKLADIIANMIEK
jgi:electron transfer flavoprotein beta subunit